MVEIGEIIKVKPDSFTLFFMISHVNSDIIMYKAPSFDKEYEVKVTEKVSKHVYKGEVIREW